MQHSTLLIRNRGTHTRLRLNEHLKLSIELNIYFLLIHQLTIKITLCRDHDGRVVLSHRWTVDTFDDASTLEYLIVSACSKKTKESTRSKFLGNFYRYLLELSSVHRSAAKTVSRGTATLLEDRPRSFSDDSLRQRSCRDQDITTA